MRVQDTFRLFMVIASMILFLHILLIAPREYAFAWFHTLVNLGIILINIMGEIIIISIEKGVGFS